MYGPGRDLWGIASACPGAQEARRKGGHATSGTERAGELLPARLQPVVSILEGALGEVHRGELDPRESECAGGINVILKGPISKR